MPNVPTRKDPRTPVAPPGETRAKIRDLWTKGLSPREIAGVLSISTQGVHWHLNRLERDGEIEKRSA